MLTVHVRINDSATGKPIPARLRITDAGGVYRPPLGRFSRFRTGPGEDVGGQVLLDGRAFAYIDGACEVRLPPGPLTIEVARGPEYTSLRHQVMLAPGQISLRLAIDRWTDERPAGWYSGDVRAHDLSPHAALLEGAAEGLSVVQLLAYERPAVGETLASASNLLGFSGAAAALRSPECLVAVNTLNTHPILGTVSLLNSHRPVFPLRFGAGEPDNWSLADWCDQCHRKKGLTVWPDQSRLDDDHPQGEALAALVLGKIDAFEVGPAADLERAGLSLYYRLLGCGLRPVLVAGSGKNSNAVALGALRTYGRLLPAQEIDAPVWIEAVRSGRTFITSGPLLSLSVDGQEPGSEVRVPPGRSVRIHARARSASPFDHLQLLAGGPATGSYTGENVQVIATASPLKDRRAASVETEYCPSDGTWIAARCSGAERGPGGIAPFAHTNPVYLIKEELTGATPIRPSEETLAPLLAVLERTLDWVEHKAHCETERQRQHLGEVLLAARRELLKRMRDSLKG